LAWSVFYAVVAVAEGLRHGESPLAWWSSWAWLVGPSIHLWFLPFAFLVALGLYPLARRLRAHATVPWFAGIAVATVVACVADRSELPVPFGQWASVLPAVVLGVGLAAIPVGTAIEWKRLFALAAVVLLAFAGTAAFGHLRVGLPMAVGLLPVVIAWAIATPAGPRLIAWSRLSLGVYLVHPFVGRVFLSTLESRPLVFFAATAAGSLTIAAALRATRLGILVGAARNLAN
jgi:hypothetical protein